MLKHDWQARKTGLAQVLFEAASRHPQLPCAQLPMVSQEGRKELLRFNQQPETNPADKCIHDLFEASAQRGPSHPCLRGTNETLSYQQVDDAANQLAHMIHGAAADRDAPVGIMLERTTALYTAMLAVLKAGRCYVPLDPSYPAERLAFMAEDSGMSILINQESLVDSTPASRAQVLDSPHLMFQ